MVSDQGTPGLRERLEWESIDMKKKTRRMYTVFCQQWEESERGWGVRPDGFSLHLSVEDAKAFASDFMKNQRRLLGEAVPDEYERPCGEPYKTRVGDKKYALIKSSKNGVRYQKWEASTPRGGGSWRPLGNT